MGTLHVRRSERSVVVATLAEVAASALAAAVAFPASISAIAFTTRTLDVFLPALGANTATRTRPIAFFEAVRTLLVAVPKTSLALAILTVVAVTRLRPSSERSTGEAASAQSS